MGHKDMVFINYQKFLSLHIVHSFTLFASFLFNILNILRYRMNNSSKDFYYQLSVIALTISHSLKHFFLVFCLFCLHQRTKERAIWAIMSSQYQWFLRGLPAPICQHTHFTLTVWHLWGCWTSVFLEFITRNSI